MNRSRSVDRRDNAFDATEGYYLNLNVSPFLGLSDTGSGVRATVDGRVYRSFGESERLTLAARGQVGTVVGASADEVPASYLFYSGGGGTVRGQNFQSLGVDLPGGDEAGGASFVGGQFEARVNVSNTIGLVGFYDVGFVGPDDEPFTGGEFHAGAGIGLRYKTGIGPIRFDIGTPASGGETGDAIEIYIGIGQAF